MVMNPVFVSLWLALAPNTLPRSHQDLPRLAEHPWIAVTTPDDRVKPLELPFKLARQTTNYYHASPTQALNIELVAKRLNGTVVPGGTSFNYFHTVGPYTEANGYGWGRAFVGERIVPSVGGGVCQGSSTLYAAVLRTGLPVLERHQHGLTVPYLPPGEDATVAGSYLNFRFLNDRKTPVLIQASAGHRHLKVTLWGASPAPEIKVHHQILARYPFRTVHEFDPSLPPGQTKVLSPGQEGVMVKSWLVTKTSHGLVTKPLGVDRYRASPRIIVRGPNA